MHYSSTSLGALLLVAAGAADAAKCPIHPFNNGFVFGKGLKASDVVTIPTGLSSLLDGPANKPFQVNIDDRSIFAPTETNVQTGFRRAEMLPMSNNGTDPSTSGIKTVHWSMMKDPKKPLNLTHEYQMVFLESSIFSSNQFALNLTQVYYSQGNAPLVAQGQPIENDIPGQGQFHFGVLKKSINGTRDLTKSGFHESGINEGIIFGSIFEEDSVDGYVTLSL
ncbi:hypothetical protein CSAL01_09441 [Colletotrichum salicis]|uniref:Glycoside hydrolase 131 catalytic N-terminal domain-containing protein n=1 Tax=Colletotrichum salicis TaxID=1209931 RepID=A0A135S914_9PEZI|nr:hypothetical protein CSAL01_09441 [Colletotrichum salicis]